MIARIKSWIKNKIQAEKATLEFDKIPLPKRDGRLLNRLLPIIMGGFDSVLDENERLYLRLLFRLVDKSFDEYLSAREYLLEELKTGDKLAYRFIIINHLEKCINAFNRAISVFRFSKNYEKIGRLVSRETKRKLQRFDVSTIRNTVEHIDRDILKGLWKEGLFLDVDNKYEKICINKNCISFFDLKNALEQYHQLVLEISNNLPNRYESGEYYYDEKKTQSAH